MNGSLEGLYTHLSSVRLIKILPSVENTMKDIRNCGLTQEESNILSKHFQQYLFFHDIIFFCVFYLMNL